MAWQSGKIDCFYPLGINIWDKYDRTKEIMAKTPQNLVINLTTFHSLQTLSYKNLKNILNFKKEYCKKQKNKNKSTFCRVGCNGNNLEYQL